MAIRAPWPAHMSCIALTSTSPTRRPTGTTTRRNRSSTPAPKTTRGRRLASPTTIRRRCRTRPLRQMTSPESLGTTRRGTTWQRPPRGTTTRVLRESLHRPPGRSVLQCRPIGRPRSTCIRWPCPRMAPVVSAGTSAGKKRETPCRRPTTTLTSAQDEPDSPSGSAALPRTTK